MDISAYPHDDNIMVLEISGEVDAATAPDLSKSLKDLLDQGHRHIVIDVSKMNFISSAGIRALLYAHREAAQEGGELRLVAPKEQARRTFEITGVNEFIQITNEITEALNDW